LSSSGAPTTASDVVVVVADVAASVMAVATVWRVETDSTGGTDGLAGADA
jgi:hypothetical protein